MFAAGKATSGAGPATYIEDVFSTYLYTGNSAARSISNGVDLSTKGGMVWIKSRPGTTDPHVITDTARGATKYISSNTTTAQTTNAQMLTAFNTDGFSLGTNGSVNQGSTTNYASWTFRKQPKFFDVVTYTGNGATQNISHSLGAVPGCIIVKRTDSIGGWLAYHTGLNGGTNPQNYGIYLDKVNAQGAASSYWNNTAPTSTVFTVGTDAESNASGGTYVAYLFAHDAGGFGLANTDNVISCGSFTGTGSDLSVNLGYEPQWLLVKRASSGTDNWRLYDTMRGMIASFDDNVLFPNLSIAESSGLGNVRPTATGFDVAGGFAATGVSYIYIAIRRGPMKVPTDGTKVFAVNSSASASTPLTVTTNFPVDMSMQRYSSAAAYSSILDRLRGGSTTSYARLLTQLTNAEATGTGVGIGFDSNTAIVDNSWIAGTSDTKIYWDFRRAPSFFDVVCYTGVSPTYLTVNHNLGVPPEMIITKSRSTALDWDVGVNFGASTYTRLYLNLTSAGSTTTYPTVFGGQPTATSYQVTSNNLVNQNGSNFVAYLFATCPGVSKVGSYTGNGSSQTINCGFAAGARFVLIKRTDSSGDWYVWDTARGIVAGNDPHLSLNTTAAEVTTDDTIDPDSSGFIVNQFAATNVNVNAATYIYLAIA